ncbi:hypothetical protein [Borreliella mayonii]|nr:hypothetical protein [Borreliella mayonii]
MKNIILSSVLEILFLAFTLLKYNNSKMIKLKIRNEFLIEEFISYFCL